MEGASKRQLEQDPKEATPTGTKRAREEVTHISKNREECLSQCKRQVEYYLNDENLRYDAFFQKILTADEEHWLPMESLLTCKRIQQLGVADSDIAEALAESDAVELRLEEVTADDGTVTSKCTGVRRKGNAPLPALEERPPRKPRAEHNHPLNNRSEDHHSAGCLIKITNLPEEAGWEVVKVEVSKRLPEPYERPQTEEEIAAGRKPYIEYPIRFVSQPSPQGVCCAHLAPFENDQETIATWEPFNINGMTCPVSLISEFQEAMSFVRSMPTVLQKRREKEIQRKKALINSRPISVSGNTFASVDHLKRCLKEVLNEYAAGKMVNKKTALVLEGLLKYHPNGEAKLKDCTGFKVDISDKATKSGETTRCFFVVKSDGTAEDFSLQKCFNFLSRNPPFVTEENQPPATEAAH